jgi:hypothetical protein
MNEQQIRDALVRHLANPADRDLHDALRHQDVVLEFPQSGERIVGLANIRAMREAYPADVTFAIRRVRNRGDLWVLEGVTTYDGASPFHGVAIIEFRDGKMVRETIYGGEPWEPPAWRAQWVERAEQGPAASSPNGMEQTGTMTEQEIRAELIRHWSEPDNHAQTHEIYHDDLVLEFPQGGERLVGLSNVRAMREAYPATLTFAIQRMWNSGELWVTELVLTYDGGAPVHAVNVMEFRGDKVAHETIYFGDPWEAPAWRAPWSEAPALTAAALSVDMPMVSPRATPRVARSKANSSAWFESQLATVLGIQL